MLHRFAKFVAGCTVLLVLAGSLVTSTGSGLSVPDWPTTYGWNMFTFPPSKWVGGILYEHGHRLIATTVGFLTIVLAALSVWLGRNSSIYDFWFYITTFSRYPMEIYQGPIGGWIRWGFTFMLPILIVVNVPARMLAKRRSG